MSIKSIIRKKFLETNQYYIEEEELEEAMIGFGGVKPKGEFVMLAGGPGSGKGWVKDNIINQSADFKSFDVDELKKLMVKTIARKKVTGGKIPGFGDKENWIEFKKQHQTDQLDVDNPEHRDYIIKTAGDMDIEKPEVALKFFKDAKEGNYWVPPKDKKNPQEGEWDFKNASHVSLLHGIVASLGEKKRFFDYMFQSQKGKDRENMDNILADVTGGKIPENIKMLSGAKEAGFRTSLVFVLTDKETAWYNNISRDRKVAKSKFSDLHNTIPPNISKMLEEQSQYLDRAFIVFSTPRGDGTPILDLKVQIPSANWFLDAMTPKKGESEQDFKIRKDKAKKMFKKRENLIAALRAMANQQGLSVKELLKKVSFKGTHADTSGFEYGDIIELKKVGDSFELPNQIKKKMDEFSKEANYIEDPEKIPEFMKNFKGWEREIGL